MVKRSMKKPGIIEDLLAALPERPVPVRSVLVGVHWTAVCSTRCGLATTMAGDKPHDHTAVVRDVGRLHTKSAQDLAALALSENTLEAGIGVAAINSLLEPDERNAVEMNASEVLMKHGTGKNIALVGHFPFIPKLRTAAKNLRVMEQHPSVDDYPAVSAAEFIPESDVVALTASALMNHTIDDLLALCRPDALVMVLGPSAPLSPVLFRHGVAVIAGSRVMDEAAVLSCVGQGAMFRQVAGVRLLAYTRPGTTLE